MNQLDTIAAVSTPYGKGGIAVLRISGEDAEAIADKIFEPKNKKKLSQIDGCRATYGSIFEYRNGNKVQIDDGIAVVFRAPQSFTGENTVEISCHGGILVTQKVLSAILSAGARMALPGEFTKRSFINGKMSLSSAEALGDLLEAQSDEQISLARSGMNGILSGSVSEIYNSLCTVLAAIFAKIDYPDEDLAEISLDDMHKVASENLEKLKKLADTYSTGRAVSEGIPTVILGRTNAGKSSLYNRIVGRDAAIVTDIEGTTRDILTESANLGRVCLRLSDTAGLRRADNLVEKIGIDKAKKIAEDAELVLAVFDGSRATDSEDEKFIKYLKTLNGVKIAIINKSDLPQINDFKAALNCFDAQISVSADTGDGFDTLVNTVEKLYIDKNLDVARDAIIANARQSSAINNAIASLEGAIIAIKQQLPLEICCSETELCLQSLGEFDGRTVSEDIVAKIFSNFCVGK